MAKRMPRGLIGLGASIVCSVYAVGYLPTEYPSAALFLAFFMITDPPTAPGRQVEQLIFGAFVGTAKLAAHLAGLGISHLVAGLLVGNVLLAANKAWRLRRLRLRRSRMAEIATS